jgi:hypothetical protein
MIMAQGSIDLEMLSLFEITEKCGSRGYGNKLGEYIKFDTND